MKVVYGTRNWKEKNLAALSWSVNVVAENTRSVYSVKNLFSFQNNAGLSHKLIVILQLVWLFAWLILAENTT